MKLGKGVNELSNDNKKLIAHQNDSRSGKSNKTYSKIINFHWRGPVIYRNFSLIENFLF